MFQNSYYVYYKGPVSIHEKVLDETSMCTEFGPKSLDNAMENMMVMLIMMMMMIPWHGNKNTTLTCVISC